MGGLGNQMFQYAAGRRLAHIRNTHLKIDLSWFDSITAIDTKRHYALNCFTINETFAAANDIKNLANRDKLTFQNIISKALKKLLESKGSHIKEKYFHFDPNILSLPYNIYLEGYWQSEKYFKDIKDLILDEFTVKTMPVDRNRELAEMITKDNAVSLHVRRGDFISNPAASKFHGTCSLDYYHSAIERIAARVDHPTFFVFSDDTAWVKDNLSISYPVTYINNNTDETAYEDMRLMSLCKHNIIANSSFSWWGAWLNRNTDKIVIAPSRWFNEESIDTRDLIPDGWIKL